ncbi:MAG: diacylglycerol kinase family protein [Candidatus Zixiibacteriota bacterium]
MTRTRHQKEKNRHYALFLNRKASGFQARTIEKLTKAIRQAGAYYTIHEPDSAMTLLKQAQQVKQLHATAAAGSPAVRGRGDITALVACGGDGTVNLVARAASELDLPVGVLPLGQFNNIARHLYGELTPDTAVAKIVKADYRTFDIATAADQPFIGAVALGFVPELARTMEGKKLPRFGLGWSQLGAKAAANVQMTKSIIRVDAFRFEVTPVMINIHLLPYAAALPFSPASLTDDNQLEVAFDVGTKVGDFSAITRLIYKKKFLFGDELRMYRGHEVTIQPTKGKTLYLDGELIPLPTNFVSIKMTDRKVKLFC